MKNSVIYLALRFSLVILLMGLQGCISAAPQFYARDMSSGWLIGPFEIKNGTFVYTTRGAGFQIIKPNSGELDTLMRLKSTRIKIEADKEPLPSFVDKLMEAQRQSVDPKNSVQITIFPSDVWKEYGKMPEISISLHGGSLFEILRTAQLQVNPPFIYSLSDKGVLILPVHVVSEE